MLPSGSIPQRKWPRWAVLRPGTPVAGGGADNACGAVGNGVVEPGLAHRLSRLVPVVLIYAHFG